MQALLGVPLHRARLLPASHAKHTWRTQE